MTTPCTLTKNKQEQWDLIAWDYIIIGNKHKIKSEEPSLTI